MTDMTINYDAARAELHDERAKIVHQLDELGATEKGELKADTDFGDGFADAAAATAERTEVLGLVENLMILLGDVDQALNDLDEGHYGVCNNCGKDIGAARMEARPTSTLCVECKSNKS
ncbi:MAG: TraR/DksA family transcriptional regulator [Acidimicrobiia bacterium]|nr:TraR/DksA family transcriptional regulator [Acidimicrobiia bacterium]